MTNFEDGVKKLLSLEILIPGFQLMLHITKTPNVQAEKDAQRSG